MKTSSTPVRLLLLGRSRALAESIADLSNQLFFRVADALTTKAEEPALACSIRNIFGNRKCPLAIFFRLLRRRFCREQSGDRLAILNRQCAYFLSAIDTLGFKVG
jgi:hypothetical protein